MSYHRKRHHSSLEHEIEKVVNRELRSDTPLKHLNTWGDLNIVVSSGTLVDLSLITIYSDASPTTVSWTRDGDVVKAKTLRLRTQLQGQAPTAVTSTWKDGCALVRYIVFTWLPWESSTDVQTNIPSKILDLAQNPSAGFEVLAPHTTQGVGAQFKIHLDETVQLSPSAGLYEDNGSPTTHFQVLTIF